MVVNGEIPDIPYTKTASEEAVIINSVIRIKRNNLPRSWIHHILRFSA